jgi:hypothetical protein
MLNRLFFLIVCLFVIGHIYYYLKVKVQLDKLDMGYVNNFKRFDKIIKLKQPFKFKMDNYYELDSFIKNKNEYINVSTQKIKIGKIKAHLEKQTKQYSDNNDDYIEEKIDINEKMIITPKLKIKNMYDLIIGSNESVYPIKLQLCDVFALNIISGKCKITLLSPNNKFNVMKSKNCLEFTINNKEAKSGKYITYILNKGDHLSVPPHWFIKIDFMELSYIITQGYHTPFSIMANTPKYIKHYIETYKDKKQQ